MENHSADLAALQRWMQAVITHPAGIVAGLQSDSARRELELPPEEAERVIARGPEQTTIERLAVYGDAYFARLIECLRNSFPIVAMMTGERMFGALAVGYLAKHPSTSYTLDRLADRFVDYLQISRRRELSSEELNSPDQTPDFTELVIEMARLEKAIEEVFDGPGMEVTHNDQLRVPLALPVRSNAVTLETLRQLGAANWPLARLKLAPCVRLLRFHYPVSDYFTDARTALRRAEQLAAASPDGETISAERPPLLMPAESYLLLTRQDWIVTRVPLSAAQFRLLSLIAEGATIGEAIAQALEAASDAEREDAERELGDWFRRWGMLGLFAELIAP